MKRYILITAIFISVPHFVFADCVLLMKKYGAPDPSSRTMAQIIRWLKRIDNPIESKKLEMCMIPLAADNPNKAQFAGK